MKHKAKSNFIIKAKLSL